MSTSEQELNARWLVRLNEIRGGLGNLISLLDDLSLDILQEAARNGGQRPSQDKTFMQARRAMDKAHGLLNLKSSENEN